MFKTILVPTDGAALSDKAVQGAIELAQLSGGTIVAVSVAEPYIYPPFWKGTFTPDDGIYASELQKVAQMHVERIAHAAKEAGVPCKVHVALSFDPCQEIVNAAKVYHCDVILMASHGRKGLNKLFVGSETQKVLAESTIPVMVFR